MGIHFLIPAVLGLHWLYIDRRNYTKSLLKKSNFCFLSKWPISRLNSGEQLASVLFTGQQDGMCTGVR